MEECLPCDFDNTVSINRCREANGLCSDKTVRLDQVLERGGIFTTRPPMMAAMMYEKFFMIRLSVV